MDYLIRKSCYLVFLFLLSECLAEPVQSGSGVEVSEQDSTGNFYNWKLELGVCGGSEFFRYDIVETLDEEMITIAPGSGGGLRINGFYSVLPSFDLSMSAGFTHIEAHPHTKYCEGRFNQYYGRLGGELNIPLLSYIRICMGGGIACFIPGAMEFEFSILDQENISLEYQPNFGLYLNLGYEVHFPSVPVYIELTFEYQYVTFDMESCRIGPDRYSNHDTPDVVRKEFDRINGATIGVFTGIGYIFR